MINARKAMEIKIKLLKALGISAELLKLYCPELPDERAGEELNEGRFRVWLNEMESAAIEYCGEEEDDDDAVFRNLEYNFFRSFLGLSNLCPYCWANARPGDSADCDACSYGNIYGICGKYSGNGWAVCRKWADRQGGFQSRPSREQLLSDFNEILQGVRDDYFGDV